MSEINLRTSPALPFRVLFFFFLFGKRQKKKFDVDFRCHDLLLSRLKNSIHSTQIVINKGRGIKKIFISSITQENIHDMIMSSVIGSGKECQRMRFSVKDPLKANKQNWLFMLSSHNHWEFQHFLSIDCRIRIRTDSKRWS